MKEPLQFLFSQAHYISRSVAMYVPNIFNIPPRDSRAFERPALSRPPSSFPGLPFQGGMFCGFYF